MRVYVPATTAALAAYHRDGALGPAPLTACAVTPALREWYVSEDAEELEYAALEEAARLSLRLLAAAGATEGAGDDASGTGASVVPRRVVVAADVPDAVVTPDAAAGRAVVRVDAAVPLKKVASVHVDADDAEADVRAALAVLDAADAGDDDAGFTVDTVEDHELLWYATQEIADLLG